MTVPPWITDDARDLFFRYDATLALDARVVERPAGEGVRHVQFRVASIRGEQVPGNLWLPPGDGPFPAVILQHGAGGSKDEQYITSPALRWARQGMATVAIDAHLHGERRVSDEAAQEAWRLPWTGLTHATQMAVDLMRTVDFLVTRKEIDRGRIGYVGFSMGTIRGVPFVALDRRVTAAVFCIGGAAFPPPSGVDMEAWNTVSALIDPVYFAGRIAPRPVLMINGERDDVVPPERARPLFDALGDPKEIVWYDGGHTDLTGALFGTIWEFLRTHLAPAQSVDRP